MKILVALGALCVAACAPKGTPSPSTSMIYSAMVAVGPGMPGAAPDGLQIVENAEDVYPPLIEECGGRFERYEKANHNVGIFDFRMNEDRAPEVIACLRDKLPGVFDIASAPPLD